MSERLLKIVPASEPPREYGRDFRLFAAGQAVSIVGDRIALIALIFLVVQLSGAYAPALAAFYLSRVLPVVCGGLFAGVLVDQVDRRKLMVSCDVARGLLLILVPAIASFTLWSLYPVVILLFSFTLLFETAARAALPDVVPEERMAGANALLQGIDTAADFAYALGGVLIFVLKFRAPFYIDAASFLFSAALIGGMSLPEQRRQPLSGTSQVIKRIWVGLHYLTHQPFLRWSTVVFAIAPFAGGLVFVLTPLYATVTLSHSQGLLGPLQSGAFRFSALEVGLGLGALLGSVVAARLSRAWPRGRLFGTGILGLGVVTAFLATVTNVYEAALVMIVAGLFNSLFVISGITLVQQLTPSEMRGRVLAARMSITNASLALGSLVAGGLLLLVSYQSLWLLSGALMAAGSLFIWLPRHVRGQI